MAGGVADGEEDGLVFGARAGERLVAPRIPVDRIVGMLEKVRALLIYEPIGVAVPPGDSLLINMLENYIEALEAIGLLDQLKERWFEDGTWLMEIAWP